jgi:hypothetical protein
MLVSTLLLQTAAAVAQTASPDSQMTQTMLAEIRQLRQDLQATAVTIQRVQIVMYRLQAQSALVDRATQRLDQARAGCRQAQNQQKMFADQIELAEARRRNSKDPSDQKAAEEMLSSLKSSAEMSTSEEQQCQVEQIDAENQFRTEQAKMSELQDQLDQLDQTLAGHGRK